MLSNRQYLPRHPDAPTHKVSSVSIAAHLCVLRNALKGERLEIAYEGSFFEGGVVGPKRNGELCVSPVADDPLEAVRVTIIDQGATSGGD